MSAKKKKYILLLTVVTAVVILLATTFAWMTAEDTVTNRLETALITDGSVVIQEVFTPPIGWKPGQTITKEVAVANHGTDTVLARIAFEEVMQLLDIETAAQTTKFNTASTTQVPQVIDDSAYSGSSDWTDLATAGLTSTTLPGDVNLWVKKVVSNAGQHNERTSYSFVPYAPITAGDYNGKNQRVTAKFAVNGTVLEVSEVRYYVFDLEQPKEAKWVAIPPASTAIKNPITDTDKVIELNYTGGSLPTTPQADKWFYYPGAGSGGTAGKGAGYFYYMGKIEPGTLSNTLLDSIGMISLDSPTQDLTGMTFDLTIKMEAIQNTQAALTASDGWDLPNTGEPYNTLKNLCDS